jgi:L-asparaginase II
VARRILRRGRFGVEDLACGAHAPMHEPSARRLIARGERPTALHNNCSGKHAGMLLACRPAGLDPSGYWRRSHPLQETILERVREYCGVPDGEIPMGVDGCSLPVSYLPLSALALGYARLVAREGGRDGGRSPGSVRERVCRAFWESPGMIAGLGRFTTDFLRAAPGRWIGKEGAEGVYAIGIRRRNAPALGIAFKMEDGSSRARDAIALEILSGLRQLTGPAARYLDPYRRPRVLSVRGEEVGEIVPGIRWNGQ